SRLRHRQHRAAVRPRPPRQRAGPVFLFQRDTRVVLRLRRRTVPRYRFRVGVSQLRAIWSLWTAPYVGARAGVWRTTLQHLASWILSYETARQHYADTALYTDDRGARILVDGLGLEFREVSTALNDLISFDPSWWSIGKFVAFQRET